MEFECCAQAPIVVLSHLLPSARHPTLRNHLSILLQQRIYIMPGGRPAGGKNAPGHSAGGRREGAGRPGKEKVPRLFIVAMKLQLY